MKNAEIIHVYGIERSQNNGDPLQAVRAYFDKEKNAITADVSGVSQALGWLLSWHNIKDEVRVVACPINLAHEVDSFQLENFKAKEEIIKQRFPKAMIVYYGVNYEARISPQNTKQSKESILENLQQKLPEGSVVFLGEIDKTKDISSDDDKDKFKIKLSKAYYLHTAKITHDIVYQQIASRAKVYTDYNTLGPILQRLCNKKAVTLKSMPELCANIFLAHSILTLLDELENSAKEDSEKMRAISEFYHSNRVYINGKPPSDSALCLVVAGVLDLILITMCSVFLGALVGAAIGGVGGVIYPFNLKVLVLSSENYH